MNWKIKSRRQLVALLCVVGTFNPSVMAEVGKEEAARLKAELTPSGADRSGNKDGSIPPWEGGLTAPPACHQKSAKRHCDPFESDEPHTIITSENMEQWRRNLTSGQKQMFRNFPDSYKIRVYPSRRSFANPTSVYEANLQNALNGKLDPSGNAVSDVSIGIPFPIVEDPAEPIWNHRLRYQGTGVTRNIQQATVAANGTSVLSRIREDIDYPYARGETEEFDGAAQSWLTMATAPDRSVGALAMFFGVLNPAKDSKLAWNQLPVDSRNQRVVPDRQFGFDTSAFLSNGLYFDDQIDGFFGSPERYAWRIVAKREMLVPYNSYKAHSSRSDVNALLHKGHLNPDLLRYELHRVWVVEAKLKPRAANRHSRRTFYIDEDSWQILMVDLYNRQRTLWRSQEIHTIMAYDESVMIPAIETHYDFGSGRYLVRTLADGDDPWRIAEHENNHFTKSGAGRASDELADALKAARKAAKEAAEKAAEDDS